MKVTIKKNLWSGIFATVFGSLVWWQIPHQILSKRSYATAAVGSDYLPRLMAAAMVALGILLLAQSLVLRKDAAVTVDLGGEARVLGAVALMVGYVLVLPKAGFLLSTVAVNLLLLAYVRCARWRYYAAIALLCAGVYFSFKYGMDVKLP